MKKGMKITTASFLALSALTPVAVFAAEENEATVTAGVYTSTGFYTMEEFQKLTTTEKVAVLQDTSSVIVVGDQVIQGSLILTASDAQIEEATETVEEYKAENGIEFTENGIEASTKLKVESVSEIKDLSVEAGTSLEQILLDLGSVIDATLNDEAQTSVNLNIVWTAPEGFDPAEPGEYTFVGMLTADEGAEFNVPAEKSAIEVTVTVGAVDVTDSIEEVAFATTSTIEVTLSSGIAGATKGSFEVLLGEDVGTSEEELVTLEVIKVESNKENDVYTLSIEDLAGTKGYITVNGETLGAYDFTEETVLDLVASMKEAANAATSPEAIKDVDESLLNPALGLTKVREGVSYAEAIKDAFVVKTVEELQSVINAVNADLDEAAAELLQDVREANTTTKLKAALAAITTLEHVVADFTSNGAADNGLLADYRTAIANGTFETVEELQAIIDATNNTKVEAVVKVAETARTQESVTKARTLLEDVEVANTKFDVVAEGETIGAFQKRINIVQAAIDKAAVDKAINALKPIITAKQIAETNDDQSVLEVTVKYPEVEDDVTAAQDYKVDSIITVPAEIAGAVLEFKTVDGTETKSFTVPAAEEGASTIEFSLLDVLGVTDPLTLVSQESVTFTVSVKVPYSNTNLATGNYTVKLQSVATAGEGETADVRVLTTKSVSVKIIGNPAVPTAIASVLSATEVGTTGTSLIGALEDLKVLDSTVEFEPANVADYLTAFNLYTEAQDAAATVGTIQSTINAVDTRIALESAIEALEAVNEDVLELLAVEALGFDTEKSKHTVLTVVNKNAALYETAIKAAVEANKTDNPTFETVEDVKAVLDEVNATPVGQLNAQTTLTSIENALLALNNEDVTMIYNDLVNQGYKTVALSAIKDGAGFTTVDAVVEFLILGFAS